MAALGEPLNVKDPYEVIKLVDQRQRGARSVDGALGSHWES